MLCLQAILLFMNSMHRFGGLLYFPMPDGMIILRYEHRFMKLFYFRCQICLVCEGIGIGFNDNMVCDAEIYYSTVFYKKNMVESDRQRRSESFAAFSVSGINEKLLLNTKFF